MGERVDEEEVDRADQEAAEIAMMSTALVPIKKPRLASLSLTCLGLVSTLGRIFILRARRVLKMRHRENPNSPWCNVIHSLT
jgi:hypothetical protein